MRKKITSERRKMEVKCRGLTAILVKRRDNYTCQRCGRTEAQGYKIDAAHILPKGKYPLMQFVLDNIIALCFVCHEWWHGKSEGLDWFKAKWPERWTRIEISQSMARKTDLKELLVVLQSEVGELWEARGK